jgi:chromosome segregation ATPase
MQQQKQEELFEEVEVVDGPEEEGKTPQETTQVVGDTEGTTQGEEVTGDEDLSEYSETVKKRISKLTNRFREEERQKQSAITYAESIKKQNEELKARLDKLDTNYVGEFDNRVTAQAAAAKEAYKKALESGDADALYEAQQNVARIAMEEANLKKMKAQREQQAEKQKTAPTPQAQPQAQPQKPDPRAEKWAEQNEWFGQDQTMTYAAFGVHKTLIEQEGFDPNSEDYYTELDRRMRTEFPHKFSDTRTQSSTPRVASAGATASRSATRGKRTVKLTPSQIAIAKRLGVPLEEYAKHVKE